MVATAGGRYDVDNSGTIDVTELKAVLTELRDWAAQENGLHQLQQASIGLPTVSPCCSEAEVSHVC